MARQVRTIIPGTPHDVAERENRREPILLEPGDEAVYLSLMSRRSLSQTYYSN
jgi:hypothetical protein